MPVIEVKNLDQFNELLKNHDVVIVDFSATWCGPCKKISPVFDNLAKQNEHNTNVAFLKVDVDEAEDVASSCNISAMPTFLFFKGGNRVENHTVVGANESTLKANVAQYV